MTEPAPTADPSGVLGDFVVAWGPETGAWVSGLPTFETVSAPGDAGQAAVRGAVRRGRTPDGGQWLGIADLIDGRLEDGAQASNAMTPPQRSWRGRFAQVIWHPTERRVSALTDHLSTLPIYCLSKGDVFLLATDLRILAASPWSERAVDLESVYHYLNFAIVPAPKTIFRDIRRLEPGSRLSWAPGRPPTEERYYVPEYPEDLRGSDDELARELRERMIATVKDYHPKQTNGWGCFLSGGTDSSSIVSILAREAGRNQVRSFSIGFAEAGYDELTYARMAAEACGADPTFGSVSRAEAQALVPRVIASYDQPFANASAIPTLACVDLARASGVDVMLAGDGGDEIFGGNERYAKDQVMEAWFGMPAPVKSAARVVGSALGRTPVNLLNRVDNFFSRASLPNPDRFYTDDSFASDYYDELLAPEFRQAVPRDASLDFMRGLYRLGSGGGPLHRIMRLDLMMAIARNDIPKVHGAARAVGVTVRFPYLDQALIAFTGRLGVRQKVRRLTKRYLFKRAMVGILPDEILRKKKQGFGLPIAVWLRSDPTFKSMVRDALFAPNARTRDWWKRPFVERLLSEHERGTWDHANHIWCLFVLEMWLRNSADAA
jgi:asparagine synthase (glutamine-hydrolysing)